MLKRRILTRLTRLGLSLYLMSFAVSFTVCAEENPFTDLLVPEGSVIAEEAAGFSGDAEYFDAEDAVLTEDVSEDAAEDAEDAEISADVFEEEDFLLGEDAAGDFEENEAFSEEIAEDISEDTEEGCDDIFSAAPGNRVTRVQLSDHNILVNNKTQINLTARFYTAYNESIIPASRYYVWWEFYTEDEDGYLMYAEGIDYSTSTDETECMLNISEINLTTVFYVKCYYNNSWAHSAIPGAYEDIVTDVCRVEVLCPDNYGRERFYQVTTSSVDVEVYKSKNPLPIALEMENVTYRGDAFAIDGASPEEDGGDYTPAICWAAFNNSELSDIFDIEVVDGSTLNIKTKSYYMNHYSGNLTKLKKSYTSAIVMAVNSGYPWFDSSNKTHCSYTQPIKINIKQSKPSVSADGKLTFYSYQRGASNRTLKFKGADVLSYNSLNMPNGLEIKNYTFAGVNGQVIDTTSSLPDSLKKGSFTLNVTLDPKVWNLPNMNTVPVKVQYTVKKDTPVLKPTKDTLTMNSLWNDVAGETIGIKAPFDLTYNMIGWYVTEGKSKKVVNEVLESFEQYPSYDSARLEIKIDGDTKNGTTYKLHVYPYHQISGRKGAEKVIDIKTVSEKDVHDIGIALKSKGTLDASKPFSMLNLTVSGKNINISGRHTTASLVIKNSEGEDVTEYFNPGWNDYDKTFHITEKVTGDLFKNNLAGKKLKAEVTFTIEGNPFTKTAEFKVAKSTVKLAPKKKSFKINPSTNQTIVTELVFDKEFRYCRNCYNMKAEVYKGNKLSNALEAKCDNGGARVYINYNGEYVKAGDAYTVKLTPYLYGTDKLPAKTAVFKVKILDPKKKKITISNKAKGSIDNIRDDSKVTVNVTLKNTDATLVEDFGEELLRANMTYVKDYTFEWKNGSRWTEIYGSDSVNEFFNCEYKEYQSYSASYSSKNLYPFEIRKNPNMYNFFGDLPEGKYRVKIRMGLANNNAHDSILSTTAEFQVIRGKSGLSADRTTVKFSNKDLTAQQIIRLSTSNGVNPFAAEYAVCVTDMNSSFETFDLGSGAFMIGFRNMSTPLRDKKGKPITKETTQDVKLAVYIQGSGKPDYITLKVTVKP